LQTVILPELASNSSASAILKADSMKYIATFRQIIPKEQMLQIIFPHLINALDSKSVVLHTYAASAIDGILSVRDAANASSPIREQRYKKQDIAPFVQLILVKLFSLMDSIGMNNEFLMKCVMRLVSVAREDVGPVVPSVLSKLSHILGIVAANPANPTFNHYMFEIIAALLKFGHESRQCTVEQLEAAVNPAFERILTSYIAEFVPYVLQIMAQTLRMREGNVIPPNFVMIFGGIMSPQLWAVRANVPALVTLLEAYLVRGADQMFARDETRLNDLFNIFQTLLATKSTEDLSYELMRCVVSFCPFEAIRPRLPQVFQASFLKYSQPKSRSVTLAHSLVTFACMLVGKRGPQSCFEACDALGQGTFLKFVTQILIPTAPNVPSLTSKKICAIGLTRLICEFQFDEQTWSALVLCNAQVIAGREQTGAFIERQKSEANDQFEQMIDAGHSSAFARLLFAKEDASNDFFPEVPSASKYFIENLFKQQVLGARASQVISENKINPKLGHLFQAWATGRA
jgi:exportin-2 (importin alpha re-exporter)